jgi:hypothetical protein
MFATILPLQVTELASRARVLDLVSTDKVWQSFQCVLSLLKARKLEKLWTNYIFNLEIIFLLKAESIFGTC